MDCTESSSPVINKCVSSDDESALLDDVKVCDICGDAGREDLLAVCSKCGDGAEHIYCMRTKLEKVPDNSWMCEECVLSENKYKVSKAKTEQFVSYGRQNSSNRLYKIEEFSKGSDHKVHTRMNSKALVSKISKDKVSYPSSPDRISSNQISAVNQISAPAGKQLAIGTLSKPSSLMKDGNYPYLQNSAIKPGHELSSRSRSIQENAAFPSVSGNFTKSKSFGGSDKRTKVLRLDEIPKNQFSGDKRKFSTTRAFRKSVSFNDAISGCSSTLGPKSPRISTNICEDRDVKRLRNQKEHDSVDKTSAFHGETKLTDSFVSKWHKAKPVCISKDKDNVIKSSQAPRISSASGEMLHRGDENYDRPLAKVPMRSSNTIGEDKQASQKESSSQTENGRQASIYSSGSNDSRMREIGSEYNGRSEETHLADCSSVSIIDGTMVKDTNVSDQIDLSYRSYDHLAGLVFPKFDYIWRGEFEIQSERLPRLLYRIQAHLSTQASPSIPEAVKKFSDKILLEEVSRFNAWPAQFQEHYPQDNSIGLYFFAEDITSYGNYKSLLHCMTDHDLALRGNLNGIEVLIFSSNLLPEGSKLWNGLLFLWGVFKARKGQ